MYYVSILPVDDKNGQVKGERGFFAGVLMERGRERYTSIISRLMRQIKSKPVYWLWTSYSHCVRKPLSLTKFPLYGLIHWVRRCRDLKVASMTIHSRTIDSIILHSDIECIYIHISEECPSYPLLLQIQFPSKLIFSRLSTTPFAKSTMFT